MPKGVFFFKQKTAYEIVDCDWSSDVCSSDLMLISLSDAARAGNMLVLGTTGTGKSTALQYWATQIGRASCRERV